MRMAERAARLELLETDPPLLEARPHHGLEVRVHGLPGRHSEIRQMRGAVGELDVAALGDPHRVLERVRIGAEHGRHLVRRLEEELIAVVLQALVVTDALAGADAQQDVVRVLIGLPEVVDVVRADERQAEVARDRQQPRIHDPLFLDALILHLEEEIAGAEDVAVGRGGVEGLACLIGSDAGGDLALQTTAEADQALGVLCQQRLVDARLVVEAFGVAGRDELDQVVEAFEGLGEEDEVVGGFAGLPGSVVAGARRDVDLAPENRRHAALARLVVKRDRRKQVAVLGDGDRRHLQLRHPVEQFADAAGAVEQRKLGVQMQVDEFVHHSHSIVAGGFELMS